MRTGPCKNNKTTLYFIDFIILLNTSTYLYFIKYINNITLVIVNIRSSTLLEIFFKDRNNNDNNYYYNDNNYYYNDNFF